MTTDLGINSDSIKYEVALEILGQERAPLTEAIREEKGKAAPSAALIRFYETRLRALDELQDTLRTSLPNTCKRPKNSTRWCG